MSRCQLPTGVVLGDNKKVAKVAAEVGMSGAGDSGPKNGSIDLLIDMVETERARSNGENTTRISDLPWFDGSVVMGTETEEPPPPPENRPEDPAVGSAVSLPRLRPWLTDRGELGRGGMSSVRDVVDRSLRRRVAMKVLHAALGKEQKNRQRFVEEGQITGQLDHPNIPPVHDLWVDDRGNVCFTMKLVRGETLTQILNSHSPAERSDADIEQLLKIFLKVCDAISFAHSRGVIHRDLKPDNVMVGSHGQVWVMDWGFALLTSRDGSGDRSADWQQVSVARDPAVESLDPPDHAIGSVAYMAPEQALAQNDRIDERTDVYLLGGILYQILTRLPPHYAGNVVEALRRAQTGLVADPQDAVGDVKLPPDLCRIAMRALQADPAERYQSVEQLKEDVEWSLRNGFWFSSKTFPAGTVVFRENDPADKAYIITGGSCEVFRVENGKRVCLRRMGRGETFGETAIFSGQARSAGVQVIEEMTAIVVTRESFERAMGGSSWMGFFIRALAERFLELDERLTYLRQLERAEKGT